MTNEDIAVCYSPKQENSREHAVKLFVERVVLPDTVMSYTDESIRPYILKFLNQKASNVQHENIQSR
jgi:hypothetical protein